MRGRCGAQTPPTPVAIAAAGTTSSKTDYDNRSQGRRDTT